LSANYKSRLRYHKQLSQHCKLRFRNKNYRQIKKYILFFKFGF
jgi:hypothetical protein